jgi:hypothetical protein
VVRCSGARVVTSFEQEPVTSDCAQGNDVQLPWILQSEATTRKPMIEDFLEVLHQ